MFSTTFFDTELKKGRVALQSEKRIPDSWGFEKDREKHHSCYFPSDIIRLFQFWQRGHPQHKLPVQKSIDASFRDFVGHFFNFFFPKLYSKMDDF